MNRFRLFFAQWIRAVSTFPLAFIVLAIMSIVGVCMVYSDYDNTQYLLKIMLSCLVALPLTIAGPLHTYISGGLVGYKSLLASALGVIVGGLYYMGLPLELDGTNHALQATTIGGLVLSRFILLLTIAWTKKDNQLMIRVWRKEFLLSIVMGGVAGGIIWGGISACLVSLDYLFGISINSHAYGYVGMVSMIFIAGAIALIHIVNQNTGDYTPLYGRSMRIFGHYIFLPLTVIYGCILISYGIKILLTGVRPRGMIVYMVTGYVGFGILTRLTTFPSLPNTFISKAHRLLFISFLLTSFLMIQAARMRIDQYGFTVARYFICAIIIWIIVTSILNIFLSKHRYVTMITTLIVLGIISVYGGPRSAVSFSNASQKALLEQTLGTYNISLPLTSGSLVYISSGDASKVYNIISYICDAGDESMIHGLIPQSEQGNIDKQSTYMKSDYIFNYAGLDYGSRDMYDDNDTKQRYFSRDQTISDSKGNNGISLQGYSTLYELSDQKNIATNIVSVYHNKQTISINLGDYGEDLFNIVNAANDIKQIPKTKKENIQYTSGGILITTDIAQLILTNISGYKTTTSSGDTYTIQYYRGYLLVH